MTFKFQAIKSRALRRIYKKNPISSHPFISGDTYRRLCEIDLTNSRFEKILSISESISCNIFLPVHRADTFSEWLDYNHIIVPQTINLILHNGDSELKYETAVSLRKTFTEIFSVNWLGQLAGVYPIPIGLENANLFQNGNTKNFLKDISETKTEWVDRPFEIYISLNTSTNSKYRSNIKSHFRFSKNVLAPDEFEEPNNYRKSILRSKFVVSPPGNGPDCHRTWESIYLGAVPIVLSQFWNFGFDLPVIAVTKWSESENAIKNFDLSKLLAFDKVVDTLEKLFIEKHRS